MGPGVAPAPRVIEITYRRGAAHGRMRVRPSRDRGAVSGGARERGTGADGWGPARGGYAPRVGGGVWGPRVNGGGRRVCLSFTDGRLWGDGRGGARSCGWGWSGSGGGGGGFCQPLGWRHVGDSISVRGTCTRLHGRPALSLISKAIVFLSLPACFACFISGRVLQMLKNCSLYFILSRFNFFSDQVLLSLIIL